MESSDKKLNELEEMIQDLETQNNEWTEKYDTLEKKLVELSEKFDTHSHNNLDGSKFIENYTPKLGEDGDIVMVGNQGGVASGSIGNTTQFVIYGGSPDMGTATIGNQIERGAMQLTLFPQLGGDPDSPGSKYDFMVAQGRSLLQLLRVNIPIKAGDTTVKIEGVRLKVNEFVGRDAVITMNKELSINGSAYSRVISNTVDTITFEDPYPRTETIKFLEVHTPVSLGSGNARFREAFVSGKKIAQTNISLILGMGILGKAAGLYISDGTPNTTGFAKGSICLDLVGGSMYVYQSTSWVIK